MKTETILKVEQEVERFKQTILDLYKEVGAGEQDTSQMSIPESTLIVVGREHVKDLDAHWYSRGRHTAALRRASMDLTRALADLRQNR